MIIFTTTLTYRAQRRAGLPVAPITDTQPIQSRTEVSYQRVTSLLSHISFWLIIFSHQLCLQLRQNPTQFLEVPSAPHQELQQWPVFLQGWCCKPSGFPNSNSSPLTPSATLPQSSFPQRPQLLHLSQPQPPIHKHHKHTSQTVNSFWKLPYACDCHQSLPAGTLDLPMLASTDLPVQKDPCATSHIPVSRNNHWSTKLLWLGCSVASEVFVTRLSTHLGCLDLPPYRAGPSSK